MLKAIHTNIKERRKALKMTQSELAEKLGYADKSMIAKIEAGLVDLPQSRIEALAAALGTTKEALTGWSEKRKDDSFSYCLEQQLHTLGYDLTYTPDGDIILQHAGVAYEITEQDVKDLEARVAFMIRFAVEDLTKNARKIGG